MSPDRFCEVQIVMRDTVTKKPRGFGFITFSDPDIADAVCREQHSLDGRQVRLILDTYQT